MISVANKKIPVFLCLTFAFSAVFYYFIITSGSIHPYSLGLMWCPGIAAIITQLIFQQNIRDLGWSVKPLKYLLVGYGLPILYGSVVYGIVWLTGLGTFDPENLAEQVAAQFQIEFQSPYIFTIVYGLIAATVGIVMSSGSAMGEEIGWRGLLVPELAKQFSFTTTALLSGIIWVIWHTPAILFSNYNNPGIPVWFSLVCFAVLVMGLSFAFAWLRLKSGSLWTAVLLHASHNLFIQQFFTPLTGETDLTPYVIDEFGIGLALATLLVAYVFWRKRDELPVNSEAA